MFGVLGKKKLAVRIKKKVLNYVQNDLFLKVINDTTKLVNSFNDFSLFLSYKIYCTKRKYLPLLKPQAIEKKLRMVHRIKNRRKVNLDRNLKEAANEV